MACDFGIHAKILYLADQHVSRVRFRLFEQVSGQRHIRAIPDERGKQGLSFMFWALSLMKLQMFQRESRALARSYWIVGRCRRTWASTAATAFRRSASISVTSGCLVEMALISAISARMSSVVTRVCSPTPEPDCDCDHRSKV